MRPRSPPPTTPPTWEGCRECWGASRRATWRPSWSSPGWAPSSTASPAADMAVGTPVSPGINARIIHASLVTGVVLFWLVAWYLGPSPAEPIYSLPDRRVLFIALFVVSAVLFGAAMFTAGRLTPPVAGQSQDD